MAESYVSGLCPKPPVRPPRPTLKQTPSAADAFQFANDMQTYESGIKAYNEAKDQYSEVHTRLYEVLKEYMKEISGFNRLVPENRKGKVWRKAWSDGHSEGYSEVYYRLRSLVELFED